MNVSSGCRQVYGLIDPADSNTYARVQLFQAHLYLFSALPMGSAPPMPAALFKSCKDVSAPPLPAPQLFCTPPIQWSGNVDPGLEGYSLVGKF